jgi:hypothetical protein
MDLQSRRKAKDGRMELYQWMGLYTILHMCRIMGVLGTIREYILSRNPLGIQKEILQQHQRFADHTDMRALWSQAIEHR